MQVVFMGHHSFYNKNQREMTFYGETNNHINEWRNKSMTDIVKNELE